MNSRSSPWLLVSLLILSPPGTARAQDARQGLEGMWSDPPANPSDFLCFGWCTDMGIAYVESLIDDPANDDRPFLELRDQTIEHELMEYVRPRLTPEALDSFPLDPLDDPGYLNCEPWGLARQMFAPHQLEITRYDDRVEMRYGEWDAHRTVYLEDAPHPPSPAPSRLGHSVGRYDGDTLEIETSGVSPALTAWSTRHGGGLRVTERYRRDGDRLLMTAIVEDPWGLEEPLQLKKVWSWAPDQEIYPYVDCERPDEARDDGSEP